MARDSSMDQRERVVAAVGEGQSCQEVSALFRVSVASGRSWCVRPGVRRPNLWEGSRRRGCKLAGDRRTGCWGT